MALGAVKENFLENDYFLDIMDDMRFFAVFGLNGSMPASKYPSAPPRPESLLFGYRSLGKGPFPEGRSRLKW